jgi:RecA/RadA recombinase
MYSAILGNNSENIAVIQPKTIDDMVWIAGEASRLGLFRYIVIDSVNGQSKRTFQQI